eukprot:352854-Chlamydomonas_euryale.AAC.5
MERVHQERSSTTHSPAAQRLHASETGSELQRADSTWICLFETKPSMQCCMQQHAATAPWMDAATQCVRGPGQMQPHNDMMQTQKAEDSRHAKGVTETSIAVRIQQHAMSVGLLTKLVTKTVTKNHSGNVALEARSAVRPCA